MLLTAHLVSGFRQRLFAASTDDQIAPLTGQAQSDRLADSPTRAGHDCRLPM
jgi:hypothetical protein